MHAAGTSTSMAATLFQMAEQDAANRAAGVLESDQPLYHRSTIRHTAIIRSLYNTLIYALQKILDLI